jgi:glycosyl hydrolase family 42 (putative beta-galactosidase)
VPIAAAHSRAGRARSRICCAFAVLAGLFGATSDAAVAKLPTGFFGVVPQGELSARDFDRMRGVVGTLRIPVVWFEVEPRPGEYEFAKLDEVVGKAADRGIRVLPFVYGSPAWLTSHPSRPPQTTASGRAAWSSFLGALVRRYGPGGSFWSGGGRLQPIRRWQIWNEPNFLLFWRPRPSPLGYSRLLRIAAGAIRREDPGAVIVAAAVAPVDGGVLPWVYLRRLYRVPGVKRSFEVVGLNPYASSLYSLEFQIVEARRAMAAGGDSRTPLEVTEFGVASEGDRISPMVKSPARQAAFLRRAYRLLVENRRRWRLSGAAWFTWRDGPGVDPHCVFCQHAGLFDAADKPKPAWSAYRRASAAAARSAVR